MVINSILKEDLTLLNDVIKDLRKKLNRREINRRYDNSEKGKLTTLRKKHSSKGMEWRKKYQDKYREETRLYQKTYREKNKEKLNNYREEYNIKNRTRVLDKKKEYYNKNKDTPEYKAKVRGNCQKNKENRRQYNKKYRSDNKEKLKVSKAQYKKERLNNDPIFKFKENVRHRLYLLTKTGFKKNKKTLELISCSWDEYQLYINNKFKNGMTWNNHGKVWQIDHIIPLSSAKTQLEVEKLCHHTNTQPLWTTTKIAREHGDMVSIGNMEKGNRIV